MWNLLYSEPKEVYHTWVSFLVREVQDIIGIDALACPDPKNCADMGPPEPKGYLLSPEAHRQTKTPKAFLLAFISVTGPKM